MVICPYDCGYCTKASCLVEGCEQTGTPPLDACEECGEVVLVVHRVIRCVLCCQHDEKRSATHAARTVEGCN